MLSFLRLPVFHHHAAMAAATVAIISFRHFAMSPLARRVPHATPYCCQRQLNISAAFFFSILPR
jgi:hypothetical protein